MKFRLIQICLSILLLAPNNKLISCTCAYDYVEYFCENVSENTIIVLAVITDSIEYSKRSITIIENLNNEILDSNVTLLGSDEFGGNCGEYLNLFSIGDTLIMALTDFGDNEYMLFGTCGLRYLIYSNNNVTGSMYPNNESIPFDDFVLELSDCMSYMPTSTKLEMENSYQLYPNPFWDNLFIELEGRPIGQIEIVSSTGERVFFRNEGINENSALDLSQLNSGLYLVIISSGEEKYINKIIKH